MSSHMPIKLDDLNSLPKEEGSRFQISELGCEATGVGMGQRGATPHGRPGLSAIAQAQGTCLQASSRRAAGQPGPAPWAGGLGLSSESSLSAPVCGSARALQSQQGPL